jgi:hypothetical protein
MGVLAFEIGIGPFHQEGLRLTTVGALAINWSNDAWSRGSMGKLGVAGW